jgi:hypothetical protein
MSKTTYHKHPPVCCACQGAFVGRGAVIPCEDNRVRYVCADCLGESGSYPAETACEVIAEALRKDYDLNDLIEDERRRGAA